MWLIKAFLLLLPFVVIAMFTVDLVFPEATFGARFFWGSIWGLLGGCTVLIFLRDERDEGMR